MDVLTWYADGDGDGWGDSAVTDIDCAQPLAFVGVDAVGDCDDSISSVYPGATEVVADGVDQDCDGGDTCFQDADGDGYGGSATLGSSDLDCTASGESSVDTDCDDSEASTYPGAAEGVADGVDGDCDGAELCYEDADGDGHGSSVTISSSDLDCAGSGESSVSTDCDDGLASTYPGATEVVADGVDGDCDGNELCYQDVDLDGWGTSTTVISSDTSCADSGESAQGSDCDDGESSTYPGATEVVADGVDQDCDSGDVCYEDLDGDGYGSTSTVVSADLSCADSGESTQDTDCDDGESSTYPGATEVVADGVDQDCDSGEVCFDDADGDGYGSTTTVSSADLDCTALGESAVDTDCDDGDVAQYPGADEHCDGEDDDCDGLVDGPVSVEAITWYADADGDGYGGTGVSEVACEARSGFVDNDGDCDDGDASVYPGASEIVADGVDQDCDGGEVCYEDADVDGYGNTATITSGDADCADAGESSVSDDCDDVLADINPGADEVCNGADDDCDGTVDEDDAVDAVTWYSDADGDGHGVSSDAFTQCVQPSGYVDASLGEDGDDTDASTYPGADETCDGADDDCDGEVDEDDALDASTWCADSDGDGYGVDDDLQVSCEQPSGYVATCGDCAGTDFDVNPGAGETCGNGVDDDCDGEAVGCTPMGDVGLSTADAIFIGEADDDVAGDSVAGAGDVDHDGYADLLVGAYSSDLAGYNAGAAYLVLGPVTGEVGLSSAHATFTGESIGDIAGGSVAGAGDTNGDGYDDVFIGASANDTNGGNAGAAYLVLGPVTGDIGLSSADARLFGEDSGDIAGWIVDGGLLDGDAFADLAVGSPQQDRSGSNAGVVYVQYGPISGDLDLASADAVVMGEVAGDTAGYSLSAKGDHDGDGVADLLVGAPYFDDGSSSDVGACYLLLGPVSGSIGLASADARLIGEDADDQAGYAISSAGDVDGDGVDDLLVGAWQRDVDGVSNAGSAYVVLGPVSGDVSLASADASVVGEDEDHRVGESVASAGDVDGDGSGDVLVGSSYDTDGGSYAGAAFLLLGPLTGDLSASVTSARFIGEEELDYAGVWVGGPGDVDADGYDDCLVGAPYNDRAGDSAGAAYLILGGGL